MYVAERLCYQPSLLQLPTGSSLVAVNGEQFPTVD